ncbi:hypothetical protein DACRYDRAFT_19511 [Dacryopinax primogenitus]|uniref:DUF6593 domain-containing protein n=1 Tax=Dacryopinax primogenitus (strain DJM 731) TaxID=1858805 RepID=M5GFH0_DACPD|nr:uncharacterized protein DACRYDRAFT_19511 [Dacryopinax primogenitus]EJU06282.1 hypothetical protein DACRYDRAFT_19511 [Dacryopinax primogenitus]
MMTYASPLANNFHSIYEMACWIFWMQAARRNKLNRHAVGPNFLHFMISHDDPTHLTFTLLGNALVYKTSTKGTTTSITRKVDGKSTGLAKIYWSEVEGGETMIQFGGHPAIRVEQFLPPVQDIGLEHQFTVNGRDFHCAFTSDRFVLTDSNDALLGHDTRTPHGPTHRLTPDCFEVSIDLFDAMDFVFVAYICMECARRDGRASILPRPYSQEWQTLQRSMPTVHSQ